MLTQKEDNELHLLSILAAEEEPVGSVKLSLLLEEQACSLSSATIGRILSEFDHRGYTVKHGYRGRTLTEAGFGERTIWSTCEASPSFPIR